MINLFALSIALAGGAATGLIKIKYDKRFKDKLKNDWNDILLKSTAKGLSNKDGQTFMLFNIEQLGFNFKASITIPKGCDFKALEDSIGVLESGLNSLITLKKDRFSKYAEVEIITRKPDFKFEIIPCNNERLFVGYKFNGKAYLVDINDNPHILFTGISGTGKTTALFMTLANLCYNYKSNKNFELWFAQIVNAETSIFKNCLPTKFVAKDLKETLIMLERIIKIADNRAITFEKEGCRNIKQYNKYNPHSKQKRIFVVLEEFSFFRVSDSDSDEIKKLKNKCEVAVSRIVKAGRAMGIHILSVLQRPTVANIDTTIRSQLSVLTFKQKDTRDSNVAINRPDAAVLGQRECILDGAGCLEYLISPTIDEDLQDLQNHVPEIILPSKVSTNNTSTNKVNQNNLLILEKREILNCTLEEFKNRTKPSNAPELEVATEIDKQDRTNGLYDKEIFKFIEQFGGITVKQAELLYYHNNNNARRRLNELKDKGLLKDYAHNKTKEKVFSTNKLIKTHEVLINDFYTKLISEGAEILEVNTKVSLLNDLIRPDMYIRYKYKGKELRTYLEVDYTHFTSDDKIQLYSKLLDESVNKFNLVILKEGEFKTNYKGNLCIKHYNLKNYTIFSKNNE